MMGSSLIHRLENSCTCFSLILLAMRGNIY